MLEIKMKPPQTRLMVTDFYFMSSLFLPIVITWFQGGIDFIWSEVNMEDWTDEWYSWQTIDLDNGEISVTNDAYWGLEDEI